MVRNSKPYCLRRRGWMHFLRQGCYGKVSESVPTVIFSTFASPPTRRTVKEVDFSRCGGLSGSLRRMSELGRTYSNTGLVPLSQGLPDCGSPSHSSSRTAMENEEDQVRVTFGFPGAHGQGHRDEQKLLAAPCTNAVEKKRMGIGSRQSGMGFGWISPRLADLPKRP